VADEPAYDLRVVLENRALARRPSILGLPLGFASFLVSASMMIGMVFNKYGAAAYVFMFGWAIGKAVTFLDPFAWSLLARGLKIPKIMRPS
jgi:type IV secretory pathway VirB3-like protein